ncbi:hypothetical protein [Methylibium petroleiphilum]|uniref:Uncharacterized protein n=1 Tax=Methylibium petroleiphilum (strain ATCC BAA-1232 / LMG 22953 / PM1) TaxID=420662 RepID=A2SNA4_METPP|nr:hypothetical protein [Methylibium petroleiphilum]ABM97043.1 hypothetical protein Mpe_B0268 [Methylibium petroleiphilum PM1]
MSDLIVDAAPPEALLEQVAVTLSRYRYRFSDEDSLQQGIAKALSANGLIFQREKSLSQRDRPDFLLTGGLAIEIKIGGSLADVLRQVARYAEHERVRGILVVGTPAWLSRVPESLAGKPLFHLRLLGSLL